MPNLYRSHLLHGLCAVLLLQAQHWLYYRGYVRSVLWSRINRKRPHRHLRDKRSRHWNRNGKPIAARTPVRSTFSPPRVATESLPPGRQPSKSTVEEDYALLVDVDWDLDSPLTYPPRASIASTANSDPREVIPRRLSYFA